MKHHMRIPGHQIEIQRHRPSRPVFHGEPAKVNAAEKLFELKRELARREQSENDRNPKRTHRLKVEHETGKLVLKLEIIEGNTWTQTGSYFGVYREVAVGGAIVLKTFFMAKGAGTLPESLGRVLGIRALCDAAQHVYDQISGVEFAA